MRCTRWLLAALLALAMLAVPSLAVGQGDPGDDPADVPAQVVPEDPTADDPAPTDPNLEPPQVLDDPSSDQPAAPPAGEPDVALAAPPISELTRFSDDVRAPQWQQRDSWRERGVFYRWRQGWFLRRDARWWQWRDRRWTPCPQPGDWRPEVVRPVPLADPSPSAPAFDPVRDAVRHVTPPTTVPRPTPQNRDRVIRRALRVCQVRYVRSVVQLRILRQQGRITFRQYRRGVQIALARRDHCRRVVLRLFAVQR